MLPDVLARAPAHPRNPCPNKLLCALGQGRLTWSRLWLVLCLASRSLCRKPGMRFRRWWTQTRLADPLGPVWWLIKIRYRLGNSFMVHSDHSDLVTVYLNRFFNHVGRETLRLLLQKIIVIKILSYFYLLWIPFPSARAGGWNADGSRPCWQGMSCLQS